MLILARTLLEIIATNTYDMISWKVWRLKDRNSARPLNPYIPLDASSRPISKSDPNPVPLLIFVGALPLLLPLLSSPPSKLLPIFLGSLRQRPTQESRRARNGRLRTTPDGGQRGRLRGPTRVEGAVRVVERRRLAEERR
jgi:hypothetical protein